MALAMVLLHSLLNRREEVYPIGQVSSCFKQCVGTPRQGHLVPASRGCIELNKGISPCTLDGLEGFEYVWIVFLFHANSNASKTRFLHQQHRIGNFGVTFLAKIRPPKLDRKIGIFASRSPHRPNPVGITLARVKSIRGRKLYLSGLDLIDGTPVLDIKPYIPLHDALNAQVPDWITLESNDTFRVTWPPNVCWHMHRSKHYSSETEMKEAIEQTLCADIPSRRERLKRSRATSTTLLFDHLSITYCIVDDAVEIKSVE